jgi:predicted RNase H-like HicB family nuclease
VTTVPVHAGEDIGPGLVRRIERDLEPCLGKRMVEEAVKRYRVAYARDESGWWVASVRGVRGCHTQGRMSTRLGGRIRGALEPFVDDVRRPPSWTT